MTYNHKYGTEVINLILPAAIVWACALNYTWILINGLYTSDYDVAVYIDNGANRMKFE